MTEQELIEHIKSWEDQLERSTKEHYDLIDEDIKFTKEMIHRIIKESGRTVCPKCDGCGAIRRLDGSIMRKFGLRDWNGCANCGGDRETPGKGFI